MVDVAECFRSLSCWKANRRPSPSFRTDSWILRSSIPWYLYWSIIPSTSSIFPAPLEAMHPHTITDPPPCLTVGLRFFGFKASFGYLHTLRRPSDPKTLNFDSSVHKICPRMFVAWKCGLWQTSLVWLHSSVQ